MPNKDHFGFFGQPEDNTGEFDVDQLREALQRNPGGTTQTPTKAPQARRHHRVTSARRRKRRRWTSLIALLVLLLIGGTTFFAIRYWSNQGRAPAADYSGAGTTETIIRINSGDVLSDISRTLLDAGVVQSAEAFTAAAQGNEQMAAIKPGYYKVRQQASAADTVTALLEPANRVGVAQLVPGNTLADTTVVKTGEVLPGYVSQLAAAACVPLNGVSDCFTADQLWDTIRTTPVEELGLNDWALPRVAANTDLDRRLEGMIVPDTYDVPPTADPVAALKAVMAASAVKWNATNLTTKAQELGRDPYDLAIIASLVEREAIPADMPRVATVIYNRLDAGMMLQLDSTVNYGRQESSIGTTDEARADASNPYNTYQHTGLPPTPIGGIGPDALAATMNPAPGPWMYFVKVDTAGNSCFTVTFEEHSACVAQAQANGVFG